MMADQITIERSGQDITARVPAQLTEDHDDCLAASIALVASEVPGLWAEGATARWDDDRERSAVIVEGWTAE